MNIYNAFKLENMPAEEAAQTAMVNKMFNVYNMHVHYEGGEYYLVRKTEVKDVGDVKVTKLDPVIDAVLLKDLVTTMIDHESEGKFND